MNGGAILVAQAMGAISVLVAILAVCLIIMRAGFGTGLAVGTGVFLAFVVFALPFLIQSVGYSYGVPPEVMFLSHSVGGLILSGVTLLVAVLRWPRPQ